MADISFYQYLEAAFRYKLQHNTAASFKDLNYNLPYESKGAARGIFEYARKVLPTFYSLHFPDTAEGHLQMAKDFIEKLDKHKDAEIEKYLDPARTPKEHAQTIAEARAASQSSTWEEPGLTSQVSQATAAGGLPFGIPAVSAPAAPGRVFVARQAAPPGGMEGGTGQGTAATSKINTPKAFQAPFSPTNSGLKFQTGLTNTLKNFGSKAGISFKINSERVARGLGDIAKGVGRRAAGAAGTGLGAAAPHLGRLGHGLASSLQKISQPGIGGGGISKLSKSSSKFALAFVGAMMLIVLLGGVIGGLGGTTPTGEAAPITNPTGASDISNCKFTRGDMNPKETNYKSSILLSYIQEASQKSSIPPAVLAAFIRVESPSSSNMSDDQISNYSTNCAESPTGALGIMQIQPPGTTSARGDPASCDDCIDAGAKLVGKTVSTMTRGDYCDPRTNIIVGSGWILKKMSMLGLGDGTKWDPGWTNNKTAIETLVNAYYGCFQYGGTADCTGPFNYADDVTTSIQNCQAQPQSGTIPPPALGQAPTKEFALSCPINNENNTCSSLFDRNDPCHCNPDLGYISMPSCDTSPALKYGIDVGTKDNNNVLIPYISFPGKSDWEKLNCTLIVAESETCPAPGCEAQQTLRYKCSTSKYSKQIYFQFNHIKSRGDNEKVRIPYQNLESGGFVGNVAFYDKTLRRLNFQMGIDGECAGSAGAPPCVPANEYTQCPLGKEGPD